MVGHRVGETGGFAFWVCYVHVRGFLELDLAISFVFGKVDCIGHYQRNCELAEWPGRSNLDSIHNRYSRINKSIMGPRYPRVSLARDCVEPKTRY